MLSYISHIMLRSVSSWFEPAPGQMLSWLTAGKQRAPSRTGALAPAQVRSHHTDIKCDEMYAGARASAMGAPAPEWLGQLEQAGFC